MNRKKIKSSIKQYLGSLNKVVFVYIFGSFVKNKKYRDVDVAVYTESDLQLIELGIMQAELSRETREKVDVIHLNDLACQNPSLVYEIVTHGELLFSKETDTHTSFKRKALLSYFDTAPLRQSMDKAFNKRLASDKFGARNYE